MKEELLRKELSIQEKDRIIEEQRLEIERLRRELMVSCSQFLFRSRTHIPPILLTAPLT